MESWQGAWRAATYRIMPTSTHFMLTTMVREIMDAKPETMLDVGIGFGKWGFFAREYIDVKANRIYPGQWTLKIDGIEIWERYANGFPWLPTIYDNIIMGDACKVIDDLPDYDLIVVADIIEHLPKEAGEELLRKCMRKSKKVCLLSIPLGDWTGNRIFDNNIYEKHMSVWNLEELRNIASEERVVTKDTFVQWQSNHKKAASCVIPFKK